MEGAGSIPGHHPLETVSWTVVVANTIIPATWKVIGKIMVQVQLG
jgi:hypothetical protein